MIQSQRTVSEDLGKNIVQHWGPFYEAIRKKVGDTKICTFGHKKGSKTGVKHEGEQCLPITDFELRGVHLSETGEIIIKGDGLQGFCKTCSKRRRRVRLDTSRKENEGGYDTYEKKYGKNTKCCSQCNEEKEIREHFKLSPTMECGLHNICIECSRKYGESVGDRLIKYRPDGNYTYKKEEKDQHDDHIMPLAYGGTNEQINHQLISSKENLSKSSTIPFENVKDINPMLMCERWRPILLKAQEEEEPMYLFKSRISEAMLAEQMKLYKMTDEELEKEYIVYNKKNNRRVNTKRCVEKFRKYCKDILKMD